MVRAPLDRRRKTAYMRRVQVAADRTTFLGRRRQSSS
jgi:hypothetical protein